MYVFLLPPSTMDKAIRMAITFDPAENENGILRLSICHGRKDVSRNQDSTIAVHRYRAG
jgi:hypothetical protein